MRSKKRILGVLMIVAALIIMQLPVSEADAASSASDFKMDGSTLVKYRGVDKSVSIPDTVEVIGGGAFEDNMNIELVVVPNSVKRIDPYAFWGCENLDTVVLGRGMSEVGDYSFAGCTGLEQMAIPENVAAIGAGAFSGCVNLKDITIPAETTSIAETAFEGCYQLKIHCDRGTAADRYAEWFYEHQKEMPEYEDVTGYDPSDTPASTPYPAVTQPPEGGTEKVLGSTWIVGDSAFVFADSSGFSVYDGREYLEVDTVPVANLTDDFSNGLAKFTVVDGKIVADHAYYRSSGLGNIVLPEGIEEIGQFSFARSSISGVALPEGVTDIAYGAFYHCDYLAEVTIPDTVTSVEPKAFDYTAWVESFLNGETSGTGDFLVEGGVLVAYRGNSAEVNIPDGVRVIAGEAFAGHTEIAAVKLPDSLRVVGEAAFENCSALAAIQFGTGVEEIKDRAFLGTRVSRKTVTVPASVKELGLQAFGAAELVYEGTKPELTHETSAERLSNVSYRIYPAAQTQPAGVTVTGVAGAGAFLEGAAASYTLSIVTPENTTAMVKACKRSFGVTPPSNMVIYDLTLTDGSGISLTKLGQQTLTVVLPLPEQLKGQELRLLTLDRNGQAEAVAVERVAVNGTESVRFQVNHLSLFGIYGVGAADAGQELMEVSVDVRSLSAVPQEEAAVNETKGQPYPKMWVGGALFATGVILALSGCPRRKATHK